MQAEVLVQASGSRAGDRVIDLIARLGQQVGGGSLGIGVAYASVSGLRTLLTHLQTARASQWVVGLDDFLTHPSVLEVLAALPAADVRVAGEHVDGARFHPKMYSALAAGGRRSWLLAGSANLTTGGLSSNAEAVVALIAQGQGEVRRLKEHWLNVWEAGSTPTRRLLADYKREFERQLQSRKNAGRVKGPVLMHDSATIDPSVASTVWIEVGNITGFQSEQLEIKAEQALFFGLPMQGGPGREVPIILESGLDVEIPVRYRNNAMWRFNLPATIPEVANGLRPRGGRSPFVAVFTRQQGLISLRFIRLRSAAARRMRRISQHYGTIGRTTAREYGWF